MTVRSWGEYAAEVIAEVIAEHRGLAEAEMRKLISAAYPFEERRISDTLLGYSDLVK